MKIPDPVGVSIRILGYYLLSKASLIYVCIYLTPYPLVGIVNYSIHFTGATVRPTRPNIASFIWMCKKYDELWRPNAPPKAYVFLDGDFCASKTGRKPFKPECDVDKLPRINYLSNDGNLNCTVNMPYGKTNPDVQSCIAVLEEYFTKHKDASLVYISHGYFGEGWGWMDDLRRGIFHKYSTNVSSNKKVVVGKFVWGCWNFFGSVNGKKCRLDGHPESLIVHRESNMR